MGQEVAKLVHEVDALLIILDANMNVHPRDEQPTPDARKIAGQCVVALAIRMGRLARACKGMC